MQQRVAPVKVAVMCMCIWIQQKAQWDHYAQLLPCPRAGAYLLYKDKTRAYAHGVCGTISVVQSGHVYVVCIRAIGSGKEKIIVMPRVCVAASELSFGKQIVNVIVAMQESRLLILQLDIIAF